MSQATGTKQVVQQDLADSISYRLLNLQTGAEITISSVDSVVIKTPAGVAITHGGSSSSSGAVATLSFTPASANFPVAEGYIVEWTLNTTIVRKAFFDVALRIFESQLTDSDVTGIYQGITLPSGTDYSAYRLRAWRKIRAYVAKALQASPDLVFYPEAFFDAHLALTVAEFFMPDSFDVTGEEWFKYQTALREGLSLLRDQLATLGYDVAGDGLLSSGDRLHDLRPFIQREWEML